MSKRPKPPRTIIVSRKWTLRLAAVVCFGVAGVAFFAIGPVFYKLLEVVGIVIGVGVGCLVFAEFSDD